MNEKKKARRSSILKPPKPRNPLSDIDWNPPTENTFIRQSRRVSFANNNFIKEFTTDSEKNTIWDTTYEEAINKSDHSSEIVHPNDGAGADISPRLSDEDAFNCTRVGDFDVSIEVMLGDNAAELSTTSTRIELSPNVEDDEIYQPREEICVVTQVTQVKHSESVSSVQVPKDNINRMSAVHSSASTADKENNPNFVQIPVIKIPPETILNVPNNFCLTQTSESVQHHSIGTQNEIVYYDSDRLESDMDMTQAYCRAREKQQRETIHFNKTSQNAELDLTKPANVTNIVRTHSNNRQTINYSNYEMDITAAYPETQTRVESENAKRKTINFHQNSSEAQMDITDFDYDTEITKSIPRGSKILYNYTKNNENIQHFKRRNTENTNMEITQAISNDENFTGKTKRNTIHFNQNCNDAEMDLTDEIPPILASRQDVNPAKYRTTIHFNGASEEAELEMTQMYPVLGNSEAVGKKKRNTIHFNQDSQDAEMELTSELPPGMVNTALKIISLKNRQTIHYGATSEDAGMDMTQVFPPLPVARETQRKTIHFNQNSTAGQMDLTTDFAQRSTASKRQTLTAGVCQKNPNSIRQTNHFNLASEEAAMEMTHSIPPSNPRGKSQRDTIHFSQNCDENRMDLTELPQENVLPCSSSNRQTTHFRNVRDEATIDMTRRNSQRNTIHFNQNEGGGIMNMTDYVETKTRTARIRQTIHFKNSKDADMEITQSENVLSEASKGRGPGQRNTIHFSQNSNEGNMDLTANFSANRKPNFDQQTIPSTKSTEEVKMKVNKNGKNQRNTIHFRQNANEGNMDLTKGISQNRNTNFDQQTMPSTKSTEEVKMKMNRNGQNQRNTIHFSQNSNEGNMDLTADFSANRKRNFDQQTIPSTKSAEEVKMKMNKNGKNPRNTIHFSQNSNEGNMDLTEGFSANRDANYDQQIMRSNKSREEVTLMMNDKGKNPRNTIHFSQNLNEGNMDLTMDYAENRNPDYHQQTLRSSKYGKEVEIKMNGKGERSRNTIHFSQNSNEGNMDLTKDFSGNRNHNYDQQIIRSNNSRDDVKITIHCNQNSNAGNVDVSKDISVQLNPNYGQKTVRSNKSHQEVEMQMNEKGKHPRHTIHFSQNSNEGNMDLTEDFSANRNANCGQQTIRSTKSAEEVKVKMNEKGKHPRNTIHFNQNSNAGDMDLTEAFPVKRIPTLNSQMMQRNNPPDETETQMIQAPTRKEKTQRNTIHFNQNFNEGDMDLTEGFFIKQSHPEERETQMIQAPTRTGKSQRNTIHFNQNCNEGDMDLTEHLLAKTSLVSSRKTINLDGTEMEPNQVSKVREKSHRNTIHFNKKSHDGEMNFTQQIPTRRNMQDDEDEKDSEKSEFRGKTQRNIIHFNKNYTEELPPEMLNTAKQKLSSCNRPTIHFSNTVQGAEMEMTEAAPVASNLEEMDTNDEAVEIELTTPSQKTIPRLKNSNPSRAESCENASSSNVKETGDRATTHQQSPLEIPVVDRNPAPVSETEETRESRSEINPFEKFDQNELQRLTTRNEVQGISDESLNLGNQGSITGLDIIQAITKIVEKNSVDQYATETRPEIGQISDTSPSFCHPVHISQNPESNITQCAANVEISGIAVMENSSADEIRNKIFAHANATDPVVDEVYVAKDRNDLFDGAESFVQNNVSSDFTEDDRCQVIRMPGQFDTCTDFSAPNLSKNMYLSPALERNQTLNLSKHFISYVDDTEKLINIKLGEKPVSEYSKILNEDITLSALNPNPLCNLKNCSSFYIEVPSLKSNTEWNESCKEKDTSINDSKDIEGVNKASGNKVEESFILVNSSSDNDSSFYEVQQKKDSHSSALKMDFTMPPCLAEMCRSLSSTDLDSPSSRSSPNDSFKSFVEKSITNAITILSESISLVESINTSDDFLAVSFAAKEVEKMINKSIHVEEGDQLDEDSNHTSIKQKLNEVFTISEREKLVLPEAIESLQPKGDEILGKISKWFKLPTHDVLLESKQLTLEEKIKEISEDTMWDIISIHNDEFKFTFMFGSIEFTLIVDRVTENVKSVEFFTRLVESSSHPSAVFVHSILKKKLSQNYIKSACGHIYTIFTFLDYITMTGQQMNDILSEFDRLREQYGVVLDSNLNAKCRFANLFLRVVFEATVDLRELESASDDLVMVQPVVGNVRPTDIKRLAKGCPQGVPFIRAFILSVHEYLKLLQTSKQNRHCDKTKKTS